MLQRLERTKGNFIHFLINIAAFTIIGNGDGITISKYGNDSDNNNNKPPRGKGWFFFPFSDELVAVNIIVC